MLPAYRVDDSAIVLDQPAVTAYRIAVTSAIALVVHELAGACDCSETGMPNKLAVLRLKMNVILFHGLYPLG